MSTKNRGTDYLILYSIIFLITEIGFPYLISESFQETWIKTVFVGWPILLLFKGYNWSKWVASCLFTLNALFIFYVSYETGVVLLNFFGIFNLTFTLVLHFSNDISGHLLQRSQPANEINDNINAIPERKLNFPYLVTRYKATLIDALVLFALFALTMIIVQDAESRKLAFILYLIVALLYEPILLAFFSATLGHKAVGIKVKDYSNVDQNITVFQGLIRIIFKWILGWLSFITINLNPDHRAIHDFVSGSVVLDE